MKMKVLSAEYNYLAPDGSEIRLLSDSKLGGLCHCTLPIGKTSQAVKHKQVIEIWYFIEGNGEVWRKSKDHEEVISVSSGVSLTIEPNVCFQFRNIGKGSLKFLIATMPPWPGSHEAEVIPGIW